MVDIKSERIGFIYLAQSLRLPLMMTSVKTLANRGISSSLTKMPSSRTTDRILQDNDLIQLNPRYNAVNDIFNAMSFAVMNTAIVPQCKPQLIITTV